MKMNTFYLHKVHRRYASCCISLRKFDPLVNLEEIDVCYHDIQKSHRN